MADARPNIPIALIQIDARIIMSSTLVCPVPTGCYPDGKWPNSLSPSGISKRDYVYDHVLATVAGQALEPVSRARADYVFACMKTNGKRGGRWRGVHAPSTSSRRSCRYVAAGLHEVRREERERDRHVDLSSGILSIGQRGSPGLSSGRSSQPDKGITPRTHISVGHQMPGPLKRGRTQVAEQNDVTKLYEEFEEAFVDVLTAKSEGVSFSRRMKLRLARSRLRAHKDFTQREYDAAVLRADARAWKILG